MSAEGHRFRRGAAPLGGRLDAFLPGQDRGLEDVLYRYRQARRSGGRQHPWAEARASLSLLAINLDATPTAALRDLCRRQRWRRWSKLRRPELLQFVKQRLAPELNAMQALLEDVGPDAAVAADGRLDGPTEELTPPEASLSGSGLPHGSAAGLAEARPEGPAEASVDGPVEAPPPMPTAAAWAPYPLTRTERLLLLLLRHLGVPREVVEEIWFDGDSDGAFPAQLGVRASAATSGSAGPATPSTRPGHRSVPP